MKKYTTPQNKKTLGITSIKGVSVNNRASGNDYVVTFRAETKRDDVRYYGGTSSDANEAAILANKMYKNIYGSTRNARKAGYWNTIA